MISVGVNPPKTPVTEGSQDVSPATLPNVCKMPGPPAPFIPTPLPNVGRSADQLSDATTSVNIEGKVVAIKGSYYMSQPSADVASQGTGGGLVSSSTQGKTKFVAPGSMTVKAEGKNIQLLGDAMTNNGRNPDNSANVAGNMQPPRDGTLTPLQFLKCVACKCDKRINKTHPDESCRQSGVVKHKCCEEVIQKHEKSKRPPRVSGERGYDPNTKPVSAIVGDRFGLLKAGLLPKGSLWPDAAQLNSNGKVERFIDFKFKCKTAKYAGPIGWTIKKGVSQGDLYKKLNNRLNRKCLKPKVVDNSKCPPRHSCT